MKHKKMGKKNKKWVFPLQVAIVTIVHCAVFVLYWAIAFPARVEEGKKDYLLVSRYIIERDAELTDVSPEELTFSNKGAYTVSYRGETKLISDVASQLQIQAYAKTYIDCNYVATAVVEYSLYTLASLCSGWVVIYAFWYAEKTRRRWTAHERIYECKDFDYGFEDENRA